MKICSADSCEACVQGGVILIVIVVFMAVTSSGSAELVAVSSLVSYDVYRTYINPKATGKQVRTTTRPACLHGHLPF